MSEQVKRETVGKISTDLLAKEPESRDPIELQREMNKSYASELENCVLEFRKSNARDFYVSVLTKKERLMENVLRNYFFPLHACPTPTYDQAVYKYNHEDERIEFLWVIPSKDTCELFMANADQIVPEERDLLRFISSMYNGSLLQLARKLNNELH